MSFKPGSVVGDYTVIGTVGSGGMGAVYKVQHVITKRIEALKLLASGRTDPEQEQRFIREMQVQARLHHPNIAAVYNAFRFYDEFFMVMEFIEGESLEALLARQRLPLAEGISYARQALAALAYAHAHGVVHRDIAPANMIISPDRKVKLTDFGLAKTATDVRLTQSGAPVGSPWYMAPEQVRGGSSLDARTDIYSLGAVLYEMVTGAKVFDLETAFDVMRAQVEMAPLPPLTREPGLPAGLNEVMLTALAKDPVERFQSAEEFRAMLEPFENARLMSAAAEFATARPADAEPPSVPAKPAASFNPRPANAFPFVRVAQAGIGAAAVSIALFAAYSTSAMLRPAPLPDLFPPKPLIPPAAVALSSAPVPAVAVAAAAPVAASETSTASAPVEEPKAQPVEHPRPRVQHVAARSLARPTSAARVTDPGANAEHSGARIPEPPPNTQLDAPPTVGSSHSGVSAARIMPPALAMPPALPVSKGPNVANDPVVNEPLSAPPPPDSATKGKKDGHRFFRALGRVFHKPASERAPQPEAPPQ